MRENMNVANWITNGVKLRLNSSLKRVYTLAMLVLMALPSVCSER